MIKRQIADDRAAQEARHKATDSKGGTKRTVITSTAGSDSCLIQVCTVYSKVLTGKSFAVRVQNGHAFTGKLFSSMLIDSAHMLITDISDQQSYRGQKVSW